MGRNKKRVQKEIPFWAKLNHGKPKSRREFLASGVIPFAAWAVAPSFAALLNPRQAMAANCSADSAQSLIPFFTVNLAGGPSLASQIIPKTVNGEYLTSYTKLGLGSGPTVSFAIEKEFGGVEFAGNATGTQVLVSQMLAGLRSPRAVAGFVNPALAKSAFLSIPVALNDDTSSNKIDVTGLVMKLGMVGSKLPNLGVRDSATGIGQQPALYAPPAPFVVGQLADITNAIGYTAGLTALTSNQKTSLARAIASLNTTQLNKISSMSGLQVASNLIECAGLRNVELIRTGGGDVNPFATGSPHLAELSRIWGLNANAIDPRRRDTIVAALAYNGLTGNAATVNLELGGYDYHDNTRTTGNTRDREAGALIGKILETAHYLQKPVFIYICADGATVSAESGAADSPWMSDRGIAGMMFVIAYDPRGRPQTTSSQIGGFNAGQAADSSFPTGNNPELAAQAVFANYANWQGKNSFLETYRIMGDKDLLTRVLKLQKS